jgi:hypothetical protein
LAFSVDRYLAHGIRALIHHERGLDVEARASASLALSAAAETQSGFRYHQDIGLVRETDDEFGVRLQGIASTQHFPSWGIMRPFPGRPLGLQTH